MIQTSPTITSHLSPSFSPNAELILQKRYLTPDETPEQRLRAVALAAAESERAYSTGGFAHQNDTVGFWATRFYERMARLEFLPNSPTIRNAGRVGSLSACFVIPVEDSMEGILEGRRQAALVVKSGGGVGFSFGRLRPRGAQIASTHNGACGPVAVMRDYDLLAETFTQGAGAFRKAAMMMILPVWHPDIREFIHCKDDGTSITNANISVAIDDDFMAALDGETRLNASCECADIALATFERVECHHYDLRFNDEVYAIVDARDLWREILESAHKTGDPGLFFIDAANEKNPIGHYMTIESTNPCLRRDTRLLTTLGLRTIGELADSGMTPFIWTPRGWQQATVWMTGIKETVRVRLSNGQQIVTTPDHRIAVGEEWVEAGDLQGRRIEPFLGSGHWTGDLTFPDRLDLVRLGFIQGDGNFHQDTRSVTVNVGQDDADIRPLFVESTTYGDRKLYVSAQHPLIDAVDTLGIQRVPLPERGLPTRIWDLGAEDVCLFLRGLFSANGSVLERAGRVTLKSTSRVLVQDLQVLLSALGLRSYITTNKPAQIAWKNGTYTSRESYDLNLTRSDLPGFAEKIGFVQEYKQEKLTAILAQPVRAGRRLNPTVVAVEEASTEPVYDFSVPGVNAGWANGLLVHNCGEVPMGPYESCNLASINVAKFVKYDTFNWIGLGSCVADVVRFLDDIVDANTMPTPEIAAANKATRRIGLGVMGWADALVALGLPYDSEAAVALADALMQFIDQMAYLTSLSLADERGPYGCYQGGPSEPRVRNAFRTCIAPTGTISILAGCSSGIEPYFSLEWDRRLEDGTTIKEYLPAYEEWLEQAKALFVDGEYTVLSNGISGSFMDGGQPGVAHLAKPLHFRTSHEIAPEWHVRMQAAFQAHTDQAVSKTVNLPHTATVDDIEQAYRLAYNNDCKGITIYRDGSRAVQVLTATEEPQELVTPLHVIPAVTDLALTAVYTEHHLKQAVLAYAERGLSKLDLQRLVSDLYPVSASGPCPECQAAQLQQQEGCKLCPSCGWSACA